MVNYPSPRGQQESIVEDWGGAVFFTQGIPLSRQAVTGMARFGAMVE